MKQVFEFAPAVAFLAAYFLADIYVATVVLVVALFASVAAHWLMTREVHKVNLAAACVALVLGGLTLSVRDPLFIKLKPTVVYLLFACVLAGSHLIGKRPLMSRIPASVIDLPPALWSRINLAWAGFFLFCAALNVIIAFTLSEQTWVLVKTFGFTALMFVFILLHLPFVMQYLPSDGDPAAAADTDPPAPNP